MFEVRGIGGRDRTPSDDKGVPRRPAVGVVQGWGPMRGIAARRVLNAGDVAPPVAAHPGPAHLAAAIAAARVAGWTGIDTGLALAALDLLDGVAVEQAGPEIRRRAIVLAALATALSGQRAHVICLGEPSAIQIHDLVSPLSETKGTSVAIIPEQGGIDARMAAHASQIVIGTAARLTQDMLRDQALLGNRGRGSRAGVTSLATHGGDGVLIRGMPLAFVEDADLIMVEAPRPASFSDDPEEDSDRMRAEEAGVILRGMVPGRHYEIDPTTLRVQLTQAGELHLDLAATLFAGPWIRRNWREKTILAALTVRDLFQSKKDYRIEEDTVVLARPSAHSGIEPGIEALVAAKEGVAPRPSLRSMWTYRNALATYRHLGGIGVGLGALVDDLSAGFGLKLRGSSTLPEPVLPGFSSDRERIAMLGSQPDGTVFWAPTADDAKRLRITRNVVVGETVFALGAAPARLVQIAAAQLGWEQRLADCYPGSEIIACAGPDDGLFALLEDDPLALSHFRTRPGRKTYRAAQEARARLATERRAAHLRSDRYFERILAFAGDGP